MRRLFASLVLAGAAALLAAAAGCSLRGTMKPMAVPHTTIFIQGPVDTVNHIVHVYWFGSEPDGYIAGFEVRLLDPAAPSDTSWRFTVRKDSVITVYTPAGFTTATFEARAIDERGVRDPNPARETFKLRNLPPIVKLIHAPNAADRSDTTFASATVEWTVNDPDGDAGKVMSRVWLDGHADNPDLVPGTIFTVPSDRFRVGGTFASGPRTLFIQGIDDGGMAGPIDSVRWYVKRPVAGARARLLVIDDLPNTNGAKTRVDTLYANAVANTGIPADSWTILHLQFDQPFRSAKDLEQTLKLFEAAVWYRGEQPTLSTPLTNFGDGIGPYLDGGGRMMIESLNLVTGQSTAGELSPGFQAQYLGGAGIAQYPQPPDSSSAWGFSGTRVLKCPILSDSLENNRILSGLSAFRLRDPSQALIVAPAHTLSEDNSIDLALALAVPQANGGLLIVDGYPMVSATISTTGFPQRASLVLLEMFGLLGLTAP
jgi:hypothetical protein